MSNAEQGVIGCLLMDNEKANGLNVTADMFTDPRLARIYTEIEKFVARGSPFDLLTLSESIPQESIDKRELNPLLAECTMAASSTAMLPRYANILRQKHKTREFARMLSEVKADPRIVGDQISELVEKLEDLNEDTHKAGISLIKASKWFDGEMFTPHRKNGFSLGFGAIDSKIGGLLPGHMMIIAARPSVGKSAIANQIALNVAKSGGRVELFNLEMTVEQTYQRLFAYESGLDLKRIQRATAFNGEEGSFFEAAQKSIAEIGDRLIICDTINKVSEMYQECKQTKADMAIIDYAQLIRPESRYAGNRTAEVGAISHSIKAMAKRLKIPVILLAQLNRASTMTRTKEPSMSELRESGDFEQDADQIILMWNKTDDRKVKGVKIDKNRHGEVGSLELTFNGAVMQFHEVGKEGFYDDSDSPFEGD